MERTNTSLKIQFFSYAFSGNAEGEHSCFSSTPLFDLYDHEDAVEIIDFSYHNCHDPFTPIFDQHDDSIAIDFSKPLVYDGLFVDKVETL